MSEQTRRRPRWRRRIGLILGGAAALMALWYVWLGIRIARVKPNSMDTRLVASAVLSPDSTTIVRAEVRHGPTGAFVDGAKIELKLVDSQGKTYELGTIEQTRQKPTECHVQVPSLPFGQYELVGKANCSLGTEEVRQKVSLEPDTRILLTSDKPLYQPEQTIHLRALALSVSTQRPDANTNLTFEIEDPKGNKVFRQRTTTSPFGICAADFQLADEVLQGEYRVRAAAGQTVAERVVTVKRYVLPKFKITLQTERSYYKPGERVKGNVSVNYIFGRPVVGGRVVIEFASFPAKFEPIGKIKGRTNESGVFDFEYPLGNYFAGTEFQRGDATLRLEAKVEDAAHHEQVASILVSVAPSDLRLEIVHENGNPLLGITNRYYVLVSRPDGQPVQAQVSLKGGEAKGMTDQTGVAVLDVLLPQWDRYSWAEMEYEVQAVTPLGEKGTLHFHPFSRADVDDGSVYWRLKGWGFFLRTDKTLYAPGQSMALSIFSGLPGGTYYLDLVRGRQTLLTKILELKGNQGNLTFDLPPDLFGSIEVHAYHIEKTGQIARDTRLIYIGRSSSLNIQAKLDKETYLPGETAQVEFALTDIHGKPVAGALSLSVVDEAVFALQEAHPGIEKIFFAIQQEFLEPRYQIKYRPFELLAAAPNDGVSGTDLQNAAAASFVALKFTPQAPEVSQTFPQKEQSAEAERSRLRRTMGDMNARLFVVLLIVGCVAFFFSSLVMPAILLAKVGNPKVAAVWLFLVAVSVALLFGIRPYEDWIWFLSLTVALVGSLCIHSYAIGEGSRTARLSLASGSLLLVLLLAAGMVLPALARAREDARSTKYRHWLRAAADSSTASTDVPKPDVRIRQYFPETLLWLPELITDDAGRAKLEIPLADSITTWRMGTSAVASKGELGAMDKGIRVFQDFFVDIDFPVSLTQDDEVSVPVAVYNYLKEPQRVALEAESEKGLEILGESKKTLELGPEEVRSVPFTLKAKGLGQQSLTVYAFGRNNFKDAVRRTVRIVPNGEEQNVAFSGSLTATVSERLTIPQEAIPGASVLLVKLYPGAFSQVVDGLDRLVRMPYG